ncbi:hypothetical protein M2361_000134 [Achromobacter sp. JUb104]|nr:hypothetical protein [Achromobacter sp. JUb104]
MHPGLRFGQQPGMPFSKKLSKPFSNKFRTYAVVEHGITET